MQSRLTAELAILLVDDERQTLKYFERAFAKDFKVMIAPSADEAEAIVDANPGKIGVVISDQRMPGRSGVSLLNAVRRKHPAIVRMLTTAYSELDDAIEAVNRGEIFRYIVKPWDFDLLRQEIKTGLLVYTLQTERDLLIGEKLHVRQRMLAVDRARDLAVIASGLPQLRYAKLAVDDYVRDCAANAATAPQPALNEAALDLWSLPQAETRHMSAVAGLAAKVAERLQTAEAKSIDLSACLRGAIAASAEQAAAAKVAVVEEASPPLSIVGSAEVVQSMIADALSAVLASVGPGGKIHVSAANGTTVNKADGVGVKIASPQAASGIDRILYGPAAKDATSENGRIFAAYLAAREMGGSIKLVQRGEVVSTEIMLPLDATKAQVPDARPDWLEKLFQHFENWPA